MEKANRGFGSELVPLSDFSFEEQDRKLILYHLGFAFLALFLGAIAGLFQTLQRAGLIQLPVQLGYYQILTAHGVLLALVFTTIFIIGFLYSGIAKTMDGRLIPAARVLAWIGYVLMVVGSIMATYAILVNEATVLYTFYAPLKASPTFYFGLVLLIVGSWISGAAMFTNYASWRKRNKGHETPLFAFMAVAIMILWIHASLFVAIEVILQLIPWSMGLVERVDVTLSRTLFWYFGHALVYFWLLPAYVYWYVNIPKIVGGKILSSSLPRLTFLLFILFSIPVGFHHQLNEPGIDSFWKYLQVVLTMMVVVPSLLTVFSIIGTFELAGREKGAKGIFGWLKKLPYRDARFFAPFVAMLIFIFGGAGGIVLASYQMNSTVHNTWFVTGHFHMTLASSVVLTFFGISIWLIPVLTKRKLTRFMNRLGIIQAIIWAIGMLLLSGTMHIVGLLGSPRRSSFSTYGDHEVALGWLPYYYVIAVGAVFLILAILLFVYQAFHLMFLAPKTDRVIEYPIGEVYEKAQRPPKILERWSVWIGLSILLSLLAYAAPIINMIQNSPPGSLPYEPW
ncbi:MAG: b(o/a)3-type cytochrome-c oxidase subunit 1 [Bacillaceae bacterium]|nr:b(o/a)3-type cytochrome-c oxidase subunit 1 [Bacillaceae bacterium]